MTDHLTIVTVDRRNVVEDGVASTLEAWFAADLVRSLAIVDCAGGSDSDEAVHFLDEEMGGLIALSGALTRRPWTAITVVSCRAGAVGSVDATREVYEFGLLDRLGVAFAAHPDLQLRSLTLGIAESTGRFGLLRLPSRFDLHLLHEPTILADPRLAAVPVTPENAHLVLALTAALVGGGFRYQSRPLIGEFADALDGNHRPARIVRSSFRVLRAGTLSDEIIAGAFPESGPWSLPPDAEQARAVPVGSAPPPEVAESVAQAAQLVYHRWEGGTLPPQREIGLAVGVRLFFSHFGSILRRTPERIVERGQGWVASRSAELLQQATFGQGSAVLLHTAPCPPKEDLEALRILQSVSMPGSDFPLADPKPWETLAAAAFGLVDAGPFPAGISPPKEGPRRLVYLDPHMIGPAPGAAPFAIEPTIAATLGLGEVTDRIEVGDVAAARGLDLLIARSRAQARMTSQPKQRSTPAPPAVPAAADAPVPPPPAPTAAAPTPGPAKVDRPDVRAHRPDDPQFRASDYRPIGVFYQGDRADLKAQFTDLNAEHDKVLRGAQPVEGPWSYGRRCDHCDDPFTVGVAYEHVPSGRIVHVDQECADRSLTPPPLPAGSIGSIDELEHRWRAWRSAQDQTFLWRVGEQIEAGISQARRDLAAGFAVASQPEPIDDGRELRLYRRIDRSVIWAGITILAALGLCIGFAVGSDNPSAVWLLVIPPIVILFWTVFLIVNVRNLARLRFRIRRRDDERLLAMQRVSHNARELARLIVARRQFGDWQAVIREVVHAPFGRIDRSVAFGERAPDVERPQSFLLAHARPTPDQLAAAQLRAKKQTIHTGWLSQIFATTRDAWMANYRRIRIASEFEDLRPESDNAGTDSVITHWQGDPVLYPRADFRRRLTSGELRSAVINERIDVIVEALATTELDDLLARVEIAGEGAALTGSTPQAFLGGLDDQAVPRFASDLFTGGSLTLRSENVDRSESGPGIRSGFVQAESLGPGRTFTAVAWRVDFSHPVRPDLSGSWVAPEPERPAAGSTDVDSPV